MDQITFSEARYQTEKGKPRREIFLKRMNKLISWQKLEKQVVLYYPKGQNGQQPYQLLHVRFIQMFYSISDPPMKDALYEI